MGNLSRRSVLKTGGAVVCGMMAVRLASAAAAPNASGAGTITFGGDMTVNRIGFGAMRIAPGEAPRGRADATVEEAVRVLRSAVDHGVNFIDTADVYGQGVGEERIAKALYPYRKGVIVASKGGWLRPSMDPSAWDGSPMHLRDACEASLRRLRLDRIDLYQYHIPDTKYPIEESIGTLVKLRDEGKIRHIGVSNMNLDQIKRARKVTSIVSVQNRYNLGYRASEEILHYCEAEGLVFIPWAPLSSDEAGEQAPGPVNNPAFNPPAGYLARLEQTGKRHGLNKYQADIAWLMSHSKQILPIPGTTSVPHLKENIAAGAVRYTPEEMKAIG